MNNQESETISSLQKLGLTYYGAKAYVTLIRTGGSKASDISREADIPRSKVYEVLGRLADEGWINVRRSRPLVYSARHPRDVIGDRKDELLTEVNQATTELSSLFEREVEKEPPNAWLVRGKENIISKVAEMMRRADSEISMLGSLYFPEEMSVFNSMSSWMERRGITFRTITRDKIEVRGETMELASELENVGARVKLMRTPLIRFVIVDGREIMILFSLVVEDLPDLENVLALWMPRSEVAQLMQSNFNMIWESGG